MSAGQSSGTGATTEFDDEKVRKNDILSNRDKAQRLPGQSLDGKGVQVDEYKDNPANRRPAGDSGVKGGIEPVAETLKEPSPKTKKSAPTPTSEDFDRPGFDLGGSTGETHAGKGLGLGNDAMENRKDWRLPR
ncbi:hypothetical protein HDIA_2613 [Hartmannibacter diazotrophicus]|uniref:Uncharacterized protein n=1 Tax=Hartmannibacter diazotrophicus TaxID=1482074 RepID=A0A2C9D756_9HYPH|nr:hypothetical protein [Hartmannibacter diazotrophicus]SON56154.1 hypothetical protein HDIA_2613 [Hartmannibacter diazotrophicus]